MSTLPDVLATEVMVVFCSFSGNFVVLIVSSLDLLPVLSVLGLFFFFQIDSYVFRSGIIDLLL